MPEEQSVPAQAQARTNSFLYAFFVGMLLGLSGASAYLYLAGKI